MSNDVLILFTMDVEPATTPGGATSGPASDALGAQRVREYMTILDDHGYRPTFFVHPELGEAWADLFLDLRERGADLGLHVHTVKFKPIPNPIELGGLPRERQLETLTAAVAMFERSFGFRPTLFRPGCFSANDATCEVLETLGFEGGSISIPGRVWPARFCIWSGACPHPHYAHRAFRQVPGDMTFVDIPLTVDRRGGLLRHALGFDHYADLRPGGVYSESEDSGRDHGRMVHHIADQLAAEQPALKTIVIDVHNDRSFTDPDAVSTRQLRQTLARIGPELASVGMRPVNAGFHQAISRFRTATAGGRTAPLVPVNA